jgi:hypothetical protein
VLQSNTSGQPCSKFIQPTVFMFQPTDHLLKENDASLKRFAEAQATLIYLHHEKAGNIVQAKQIAPIGMGLAHAIGAAYFRNLLPFLDSGHARTVQCVIVGHIILWQWGGYQSFLRARKNCPDHYL